MKKYRKLLAILLVMLLLAACTPSTSQPEGKIKNIILIIGDGMGETQIRAGELMAGEPFVFRNWANTMSDTNSLDPYGNATKVTDSAAGGTALATGVLTTNKRVGQNPDGQALKTILDYALEKGKATGVVTTDLLTGATPASFSAHAKSRDDAFDIFDTQMTSGIQLLCSNTTNTLTVLQDEVEAAGYTVCRDINTVDQFKSASKVCWQFDMGGDAPAVKLADATTRALEYLSQDEDGFVMMIEEALIDKNCHNGNFEGTMKRSVSLNETVKAVMDWIGDRKDTVVIVTADHETGDLAVAEDDRYADSITVGDKTIYYRYGYADSHTITPVPVYIYGFTPNFEAYSIGGRDIVKNTAVFKIMLDILQHHGSRKAA